MTGLEICAACVMERAEEFSREFIEDSQIREAFMQDVRKNVPRLARAETFYEMDVYWTKKAAEYIGTKDLYQKKKEKFQQAILSVCDQLAQTLCESEDVMFDAFRLAAAGNIIDFSCVRGIVIDNVLEIIEQVRNTPVDMSLYHRFMQDLSGKKHLVYLLDNVGECVLDLLYIKKLKEYFPALTITIVAKSRPVSSDAMVEDALQLGMDAYGTVIGSGNDVYSAFLNQSDPCVHEALHRADVILAKGMANFECMVGSAFNIYYLFLCKCKRMYSEVMGFRFNALYFMADRGFDHAKYKRGNWKYSVVC